jgi:hypothetical protein
VRWLWITLLAVACSTEGGGLEPSGPRRGPALLDAAADTQAAPDAPPDTGAPDFLPAASSPDTIAAPDAGRDTETVIDATPALDEPPSCGVLNMPCCYQDDGMTQIACGLGMRNQILAGGRCFCLVANP